jgi:hypothetical protein
VSEISKKVVLVSASPKVDQDRAVSAFLARHGEAKLLLSDDLAVETVKVRQTLMHHETEQAFETLQYADAIVFIFPLYFFCMPAMLTRFLQDFVMKYPASDKPRGVYAIINCGFPESDINAEAMRVVECFCVQTKREFLGGLMIGGGGMVIGAADAPFMRPIFDLVDGLFARVSRDTLLGQPEPAQIAEASPKFPRWLYYVGGNAGWHSMARQHHIKPKDIRRKPYQR